MISPSTEWSRISQHIRKTIAKHQQAAPVKVGAIAADLGLKLSMATLRPQISGEIRKVATSEARAGFAIRVNRHEAKHRQRFTIAHEIAHFLLHADKIKDCLTDDALYRSTLSNKLEAEANRLATDIIMPADLVNRHVQSLPQSIDVAEKINSLALTFEVSQIAMRIRLGLKVTG